VAISVNGGEIAANHCIEVFLKHNRMRLRERYQPLLFPDVGRTVHRRQSILLNGTDDRENNALRFSLSQPQPGTRKREVNVEDTSPQA
jgi:hypothetical protein